MITPPAGTFPLLHDPLMNQRVVIESIDGWMLYGPDRRAASYSGFFVRQETPLQLLRKMRGPDGHSLLISILTPSRATEGKFELVIGDQPPVRKCCYRCVTRTLDRLAVKTLDYKEWIAYMLLESHAFLNGPAPKELPHAK